MLTEVEDNAPRFVKLLGIRQRLSLAVAGDPSPGNADSDEPTSGVDWSP